MFCIYFLIQRYSVCKVYSRFLIYMVWVERRMGNTGYFTCNEFFLKTFATELRSWQPTCYINTLNILKKLCVCKQAWTGFCHVVSSCCQVNVLGLVWLFGGPLYMICSPSLETSHHNFSGSRREKTSLSLTGTTEH